MSHSSLQPSYIHSPHLAGVESELANAGLSCSSAAGPPCWSPLTPCSSPTSVLTHEHLLSLLLYLLSLAFHFYLWATELKSCSLYPACLLTCSLPHSPQPYEHQVCTSLPAGRSLPALRVLWSMPCYYSRLPLSGITGHGYEHPVFPISGALLQPGSSSSASQASCTRFLSRDNTPKKGSGE